MISAWNIVWYTKNGIKDLDSFSEPATCTKLQMY